MAPGSLTLIVRVQDRHDSAAKHVSTAKGRGVGQTWVDVLRSLMDRSGLSHEGAHSPLKYDVDGTTGLSYSALVVDLLAKCPTDNISVMALLAPPPPERTVDVGVEPEPTRLVYAKQEEVSQRLHKAMKQFMTSNIQKVVPLLLVRPVPCV